MNTKWFRRGALVFTLIAVLSFGTSGCGEPADTLRVGANIWPGYEPLFLAQSLGYYEGQNIELITFPTSTETMRAYRNHAIDVAALTLDETLQVSGSLPNQHIAMVSDFSNGADAVLAKPQFKSM